MKRGEWKAIEFSHGWNGKVYPERYRCSECGAETDEETTFCPICGAQMKTEWRDNAGRYLWE